MFQIKSAILTEFENSKSHISGVLGHLRPGPDVLAYDDNSTAKTSSSSQKQVPDSVAIVLSGFDRPKKQASRPYRIVSNQLPIWLRCFGFRGKIRQVTERGSMQIIISLRIYISILYTLKQKLGFEVEFTITTGSPDPPFAIRTFNIVPSDAPIMKACAQGNLVKVQDLFGSAQASVMDITPENQSPIYVSYRRMANRKES